MEERRVRKGKDVRLGTLLARYVLIVAALLIISFIAFYKAIVYFYTGGRWRNANQSENEAMAWANESAETGYFNRDTIPEDVDVIIDDADGDEVFRIICNPEYEDYLNSFREAIKKGDAPVARARQEFFRQITTTHETAYVHYSVTAENEGLLSIAIIFVGVLDVLIPTIFLIRRIRKSISSVSEYAKQITAENLSGEPVRSGIREMNEIVDAVDFMKENLVKSMEDKWADEQKKRDEKAQIAHDLKTPLTIIRGNADLLLENCHNDDDREAIETIIKNSERIAQSVLDILE